MTKDDFGITIVVTTLETSSDALEAIDAFRLITKRDKHDNARA